MTQRRRSSDQEKGEASIVKNGGVCWRHGAKLKRCSRVVQSKEECALSTGQRSNDATTKDLRIKLTKEECARGMASESTDLATETPSLVN
jgi:hypothetical protein